ncbi:MAG TPA: twin-arginine translocation signal domain-containing protein, partial [Candidatus Angelobacter sp.]|nr:twin-arginine translocation signal domain-containing protein [Candidatus Angelobacter sp.]
MEPRSNRCLTLSELPERLQHAWESATLPWMPPDPISRRDFLRKGALLTGALAAGLPEAVSLFHPRIAESAIMGIGQELRDVLNEETLNRILQEALKRGGDAADVFAEQRFRTSIVLDGGKIDSVS